MDRYIRKPELIRNPPRTLRERLRYVGPGLILSASIVGAGELIATTRLGAEAGFITFWVILVSCLVKVAVQLEFGKYAIYSGKTAMQVLDQLTGPRLGKAHISIWVWIVLQTAKLLQMGGIVGGTAIILNMVMPAGTMLFWAILIITLVALMVSLGYYRLIEKTSMVLIGLFTLLTIASVVMVQYTPYAITSDQLLSGLRFNLPAGIAFVAIGAFGITGIGGDEILSYNYWLIEKGYAAYTGKEVDSEDWRNRCRGWVKTMYVDAIFSMIIYTLTTAAFYLLGAAVLHKQGLLPEGLELVSTLSSMYTSALGTWAEKVFLVGAFIVLFSTLFSALAIWSHLYADAFARMGLFRFENYKERKRYLAILSWVLPILWGMTFVFIQLPALMIIIGGVATTLILLIVVYAVIVIRYRLQPSFLRDGRTYNLVLWISILSIIWVAGYGLYSTITG